MIQGIRNYLTSKAYNFIFFELSTYLFVATLPLTLNINTITLWLLIVSSMLFLPWKERLHNLKANKRVLFYLGLLYSLYWIGLIYTQNISDSLRDVERTLALLLIPLVILSHSKEHFNLKRILISLGVGLGIAMIICWSVIAYSISSNATPWVQAGYFFKWIYTSWNLLLPLDGHPSYFAVLLVLFITSLMKSEVFSAFRKKRLVFIATLLLFILFLVETGSRIGVIALVIIVTFQTIRYMNRTWIVSSILLLISLVLLSLQFDYLGSKFDLILDSQGNINFERYHRWTNIIETLDDKDSMFLGVGSGDSQELYDTAYISGKFYKALELNYNAHNQFIEFLVGNGIVGLFIFSWVLYIFIRRTKLKGDALSFFIIITLFSFSESIFGRAQGVFIFSFFYALFILLNSKKNRVLTKKRLSPVLEIPSNKKS